VVLVSHDINLAVHQCQRMMVMKRGAVVSIGTPTQVVQARLLADVYGCDVLVDKHPESGLPRVSLPSCRSLSSTAMGASIC
jgi:iron complex transport system ATP-binding protein